MMFLDLTQYEHDSTSAHKYSFDGEKLRETLVIDSVLAIRNSIGQANPMSYIVKNYKDDSPAWRNQSTSFAGYIAKLEFKLAKILNGSFSSSGKTMTEEGALIQILKNTSATYKYDIADALMSTHLVCTIGKGCSLPLYYDYSAANETELAKLNWFKDIYSHGFANIHTHTAENSIDSVRDKGDSGDEIDVQSIQVKDTYNKIVVMEELRNNFRIFLRYFGSVQDSFNIIHQSASNTGTKDPAPRPYTRAYTREELRQLNMGLSSNVGLMAIEKSFELADDNYIVPPRLSIYRLLVVAWLLDINKYNKLNKEKEFQDFTSNEIFMISGYFNKFSSLSMHKYNKTEIDNSILDSTYTPLLYGESSEQVSNIFRKAFIETRRYCEKLEQEGQPVTIDINNYENDFFTLARDFYHLLCSIQVNGANYEIIKTAELAKGESFELIDLIVSVLGPYYMSQGCRKFATATGYGIYEEEIGGVKKYKSIVPVACELPEWMYDYNYWSQFKTIDEWFESKDNGLPDSSLAIKSYGVSLYDPDIDHTKNIRHIIPIMRNINTSACRSILQDEGNGRYTDTLINTIYLVAHQEVLESFGYYQGNSMYKLIKEARLEELREFCIFSDLIPTKTAEPKSKNIYTIVAEQLDVTRAASRGDYNFTLFQSPADAYGEIDISLIDNLDKLNERDMEQVIERIFREPRVNSSAYLTKYCQYRANEYNDNMNNYGSLTSRKGVLTTYSYALLYIEELLKRYVRFVMAAWRRNGWSFASKYNNEEYMFQQLFTSDKIKFEYVGKTSNTVQILHVLGKPFVLNTRIGDLMKDYGVLSVVNGTPDPVDGSNTYEIVRNENKDIRVQLLVAKVTHTDHKEYVVFLRQAINFESTGNAQSGYEIIIPMSTGATCTLGNFEYVDKSFAELLSQYRPDRLLFPNFSGDNIPNKYFIPLS